MRAVLSKTAALHRKNNKWRLSLLLRSQTERKKYFICQIPSPLNGLFLTGLDLTKHEALYPCMG